MTASQPRKILFLITKAAWGGAQRYVYDLATHLPQAEFSPIVVFGTLGPLAQKLTAAHIRTRTIPSLARDLSITRDLRSFITLIRLFQTERPDIVHLNSSKAAGLGALAARIARVPRIVFTAHGWPFGERRSLLWRTFAYLGSWATALLAHDVITVSTYDQALGMRMPWCAHKMHMIHNGIDLSAPLGPGTLIRDAFPKGAHITGTIGELTQNKNHLRLIENARHIPHQYVAIVGEGEERAHLEQAIQAYGLTERVKLFGFHPAADVLHGFDTFTLPSRKEGLPYVLIEARAAQLPVVANRVGGVGDVLDAPDLTEFSLERMLARTLALYRH